MAYYEVPVRVQAATLEGAREAVRLAVEGKSSLPKRCLKTGEGWAVGETLDVRPCLDLWGCF